MIKDKLQVIKPLISLKNSISHDDVLKTECLFGELFTIEKTFKNLAWGTLETDGYKGWVKKKYLDTPNITNYKVSSLVATVNAKPNVRSNTIFNLPLNALVTVIEISDAWAKIKINKEFIILIMVLFI